jgi:hypothetical protein
MSGRPQSRIAWRIHSRRKLVELTLLIEINREIMLERSVSYPPI